METLEEIIGHYDEGSNIRHKGKPFYRHKNIPLAPDATGKNRFGGIYAGIKQSTGTAIIAIKINSFLKPFKAQAQEERPTVQGRSKKSVDVSIASITENL